MLHNPFGGNVSRLEYEVLDYDALFKIAGYSSGQGMGSTRDL